MPLVQHILHIDDDEEDFLLLKEAFQTVDDRITVSFMGECPRNSDIDYPVPDLIFLDINMFENDGYHWLKEMREKGLVDMPVVMYSTANSTQYVEKAYACGANLFIVKPDTFTKLVHTVAALLQLDWTNPHRIREAHYVDGKYRPFSVTGLPAV